MIIIVIVFKLNFQTFLRIIHLIGAVRVEDQRFIDWDHYRFTLWQTQLNFVVFCANSACGVSVEHMKNQTSKKNREVYITFMFTIIP